MQLVFIACAILVINYVLTLLQVKYYRQSMNKLINKYQGKDDYFLCSGQSRRRIGAGSIAMLIVDKDYTIKECQIMKGISVLSSFKEINQYKGMHIGELLENIQMEYGIEKVKKNKIPAMKSALNEAAEKAVLLISKKASTEA